ncbi:MAG: PQQ-dependent sugar dehydrogenase, partial [Kiritimatiellia bacterium]
RPGRLWVIGADGKRREKPVSGTPEVIHHGQGGLMDVAVHPDYAKNGWIYLALADGWREGNDPRTLTAIVRGRIKDNAWTDQEWIFRADRKFYTNAGVHFGSRIVFRNGYVFFVVGERGGWKEAQDLGRPNGKIYRLFDDGRVPPDNPFVDVAGSIPGIWSYGHRNPQGLVFDPRNGDLLATEHGPRGGDELNLIRRGANYGWPEITYGMNYDGTPITGKTAQEGMEQPLVYWTPSIAACGLAAVTGDRFPQWRGDFLAGALKQEEIRRIRVIDRKATDQEIILKGIGRVRDVKVSPDGYIYVVLNDPHRVIRLVPANQYRGACGPSYSAPEPAIFGAQTGAARSRPRPAAAGSPP